MKEKRAANPVNKVHKFMDEDQLARVKRLRELGWNVEACTDANCTQCVPDTMNNRLKLAAILVNQRVR